MLIAKRIDAAIMFDRVATYTLMEMKLDDRVISKGATNHVSDIYVAFSKQNPQSARLAADLDKGIRALKQSGEYNTLLNIH